LLTRIKKKVQAILASEARTAYNLGLTPNLVSLIGLILALFSAIAYAIAQNGLLWILLATILLLASGFCDALDGIIARIHQKTSIFGEFLDSLLDRYADAAVYGGIIIGGLCNPIWGLAALVGSMLVSYSRAKAEKAEIPMESVGLAERAERILILSVASIAAIFWLPALNIGIILLAVLSNLTVLQRGLHVYYELKKRTAI
jgi:archaetidylinositol phosphate synthase